jgi:hypothetical protein
MLIDAFFEAHGGVASTRQLHAVMSRKTLAAHLRAGVIVRVWHGVYSLGPPSTAVKLAALDLLVGQPVVACLHTAAELHGFRTEGEGPIHIFDPGIRMRPTVGLMVRQRVGAPIQRVGGRLVTTPAWTAVELGRSLSRPRALATLDAALHVGACEPVDLARAVGEQKGRRGIVNVRALLEHADGRAESPMESEARLVFIDGGVPPDELQFEIIDRCGQLWRVDFAWPAARVLAEYDSMQWHASPIALRHDRMKTARLQECGWTVIPLVVDDVRRHPLDLAARIAGHLERAELAG